MDDFYGSLSNEQKANFDAIGPQRLGASAQPDGRRQAGLTDIDGVAPCVNA